ncbi:MAG TPA: hypothetical protein V6D33_12335 [Cyanophyceae cyanobacterium]
MTNIVFDSNVKGDRVIHPVDHLYGYQGQNLTLAEWAEFLEMPTQAFQYRVRRYGFTEAVAMPSPNWKVPSQLRIDPRDRHKIKRYKWSSKDGGVYRHQVTGKGKERTMTTIYLHREILGVTGNQLVMVHFKNGNKYDCRRSNLEQVKMNEHVRAAMHPLGCCFRASKQRWEASITHKGQRYFLKSSKDKAVAIAAYQEAVDRINKGLPPKP